MDNSRNGHSSKTLRTSFGDVEVSVPRDKKGEFEPQVLRKNQTGISQDIEEKILPMYAKGMTTSDIEVHFRDIYGVEVSDTTVSRITDKILPTAKEWQQRPMESVYAVVFMDAIHYHVRSEGQIVKKAVYIAIGIDLDGRKDVLGMWVGENESAKYWATVLNSLKNRGIEDIFIACTDNLTGFSTAIEAVLTRKSKLDWLSIPISNTSFRERPVMILCKALSYEENTLDKSRLRNPSFCSMQKSIISRIRYSSWMTVSAARIMTAPAFRVCWNRWNPARWGLSSAKTFPDWAETPH